MEKCVESVIRDSKNILDRILDNIGWHKEEFLEELSIESELEKENGKSFTAEDNEPLFPECSFPDNSLKLTLGELQDIVKNPLAKVPNKFSDLQLNFNREQKLAIYEYILSKTSKLHGPDTFFDPQEFANFTKMISDQKAEKRKRRKYRRTKVTYIEEIRSLLEVSMKALNASNEDRCKKSCDKTQKNQRNVHKKKTTYETRTKRKQSHELLNEKKNSKSKPLKPESRSTENHRKNTDYDYRNTDCKYDKKYASKKGSNNSLRDTIPNHQQNKYRSRSRNKDKFDERKRKRSRSYSREAANKVRTKTHSSRQQYPSKERYKKPYSTSDDKDTNFRSHRSNFNSHKQNDKSSRRSRSRSRSYTSHEKNRHKSDKHRRDSTGRYTEKR